MCTTYNKPLLLHLGAIHATRALTLNILVHGRQQHRHSFANTIPSSLNGRLRCSELRRKEELGHPHR